MLPLSFSNYFVDLTKIHKHNTTQKSAGGYYQRWSPRGRPWPRGRPRGHILKSLALASRPQVLEN